ncbi:unnamed protein product [Cunninghamella blakesleeana]
METTAVRVALRTRPLSPKELEANYTKLITYVKDEPQILLGTDCSFTYDFTFTPNDTQQYVFETCITPLLNCFMDGNNATVLAYGQTATGKSYSLGTSMESFGDKESQGMIQRFAYTLFDHLEKNNNIKHQLYVSFMELYNEELFDLLSSTKKEEQNHPTIHEDIHGHIFCTDLKEVRVYNAIELLDYLQKGSLSRATGSTDMNVSSSRSHAIFTITLKQQQIENDLPTKNGDPSSKRLVSKFHFVDLAGSERLKRTNALGERQKEGISINTGLLALGNVISALGDESRRCSHIPYRDSKLTRLLQDSLGGNSHTLMLACVSPSRIDYTETLNTLKYANRARNIQNRVEINVDYEGSPEELTYLRNQIAKLKLQLSNTYRRSSSTSTTTHLTTNSSGGSNNSLINDHRFLKSELNRVKAYANLLAQDLSQIQGERDTLLLQQQQQQHHLLDNNNNNNNNNNNIETNPLITDYIKQIENLKLELNVTKNRLIEFENHHSSSIHDNMIPSSYKHISSVSMSLPGKYGGYRKKSTSTSLEKYFGSATNSTSGRRPFIRQRKHSLPMRQRMKTATTTLNQYNLTTPIPSLDESWQFLDSHHDIDYSLEFNPQTMYQQKHQHQVIHENTIKCQKSQENNTILTSHKENNHSIDKMITSFSPESELMLHSTQTPIHSKVEALSVPAWNDEPKTQTATISTKRESLSWTDSLLDDSDNSMTTSRLSSVYWETASGIKKNGRRRSKDVLKMIHQIQADILVKKELVGQLEKSEGEYTQMRMNYEEQLLSLQNHLINMQHQRDFAITDPYINKNDIENDKMIRNENDENVEMKIITGSPKMKSSKKTMLKSSSPIETSSPRNKIQQRQQQQQNKHLSTRSPLLSTQQQQQQQYPQHQISPFQLRALETKSRQLKEIRSQYESKLKRLSSENQEWKRKFTQSTNNMNLARTKAEQVVTGLRHTVDQLKSEKKQLQRNMKQDNDKLRQQLVSAEIEIHQLRRKESLYIESKKKWNDTNEEQQIILKKKTDHALQVNQQMRYLNLALRKAATEGVFLNEATLDRILAQASTTAAASSGFSSNASSATSSPTSPSPTFMNHIQR